MLDRSDKGTKLSLLNVDSLSVTVGKGANPLVILDDVSFRLNRGECLCVVGESGSGKSTAATAIMGLLNPSVLRLTGDIRFNGQDLTQMPVAQRRALQGADMAMIFQEPMTALNPCRHMSHR